MDEYEQEIIRLTEILKNRLLDKYRRGRLEHGGSPVDVNVQAEINLEVLDILNYHLIHKVNTRKKEKRDEIQRGEGRS